MGYEIRNGKSAFYLTVRTPSGFQRHYFGMGPAAALAAEQVAERKAERHRHQKEVECRITTLLTSVQRVVDADRQLERYLHAELVARGYHKHKRSEWRRRRE